MKVGLYFGSFNPIHIGHLIISEYVYNNTPVEQVWFVISPQNPLKASSTLLNAYDRLHLLKLATDDNPNFQVSDVEISARRIRRQALIHGLLSFGLNTFVVALTVNLIAGLKG